MPSPLWPHNRKGLFLMLVNIEQKIDGLARSISCFMKENAPLFLPVFLTGCFAYGYEISNMTFSIDEEVLWQMNASLSWADQSRWGMIVYRHFLLPKMEYPFISCVTGLIFLSLAYTVWSSAHKETDPIGKIIFGCLAISFPTFAHVQAFSYMGAFVGCSVFLAFVAYRVFMKAADNFTVKYCLPVLILTFVASTHQSVIYVFFTPFLLDALAMSLQGALSYKDLACRLARMSAVLVSAVILYFILTMIINKMFGLVSSGYIGSQFRWHEAGRDFSRIAEEIWKTAGRELRGKHFSYPLIPVLVFPICCILFRSKDRIRTLLVTFLIYLYYMSYNFVFGAWQASRSHMFMPALFAGFFYLAFYSVRNLGKMCVVLFSIYAILLHSSIITQLFMTDSFARKRDFLIATRVVDSIYDAAPDFISHGIPVAFIGYIPGLACRPPFPAPCPEPPPNKEVFGGSFFEWENGNPYRIRYYLTILGLPPFKLATDSERRMLADLPTVKQMPPFPAADCAKLYDGFLVVKLN